MRNISIDWLKVVLAFVVVLLHLNIFTSKIPLLGFLLCNGLFRIAVPVFLIISGYYFDLIDSRSKLKKWAVRLGALYLVWTLIYAPLWVGDSNLLITLTLGYHHLWYLISTLCGGIVLYALKRISSKTLAFVALLLFFTGYAFQTIGNLHIASDKIDLILNTDLLVYRNFLFFAFPFLALGMLVKRHESSLMVNTTIWAVMFSILLLLAESYLHYNLSGPNEHVDLLVSLVLAAPCVFLYVKNLKIVGRSKNIALFATGIYLTHTYSIKLAEYTNVHFPNYPFGKAGIFLTTIVATAGLVQLNKKLKFIL